MIDADFRVALEARRDRLRRELAAVELLLGEAPAAPPPAAEPESDTRPKAPRPSGPGRTASDLTAEDVRAASRAAGPNARLADLADRLGVKVTADLRNLCRAAGLVLTGAGAAARWSPPASPAS